MLGKSTSILLARPLGDKTPFRNRVGDLHTPLPNGSKISKLSLGASQLQTPGLLRPSSARIHDRMPSASKNFQTPHTQGNHWDVSDTEIEGPEAVVVNQSIVEEDFNEIEYMPPGAIGAKESVCVPTTYTDLLYFRRNLSAALRDAQLRRGRSRHEDADTLLPL